MQVLEKLTLEQDVLLVTLDIVSMYTNCPQDEAINSVCDALELADPRLYSIPKPTEKHTRCLLELILYHNIFEFNGKLYRQKIGVAMGSECSPEICDITLFKCEREYILPNNPRIVNYMRYRDDVLVLFNGNEDQTRELVYFLNNLHFTLKFAREISKNEVTFLGLIIYKEKRFQERESWTVE